MRESDIENALVKGVEGIGGLVRKLKWIGRDGAPDRFVAYKGWVFLVELKAPGKEPRVNQAREHDRLRKADVDVRVIDTIIKVEDFINEIRRLVPRV